MANPEAQALLRIARRDLKAAEVLQIPSIDKSSWGFHFRLLLFPSISFLLKIRCCFEANFMFWNTNQ